MPLTATLDGATITPTADLWTKGDGALRTQRLRLPAGTITVALALVLASAALGAGRSGRWTGSTTQTGEPAGSVHFQVTAAGIVHAFSGDLYGTCAKGGSSQTIHIALNPSADMTIHKGAFGFHGVFNIDNGTVVIAKHVDGKIAGRFAHGGATGSMSFVWTFDRNAPQTFPGQHCSTGKTTFTAKHA